MRLKESFGCPMDLLSARKVLNGDGFFFLSKSLNLSATPGASMVITATGKTHSRP